MGWRERMKPASFKGVGFSVDGVAFQGSRRIARVRLAGRDGSTQQDNGLNEDDLNIEAFLFGEDFDIDREELEKTLRSAGAGPLVLPSRGEMRARVVGEIITTEKRGERGYCSIRFTAVVEEAASARLRSKPDRKGLLSKILKALRTIASTDFSSSFSVLAMPGKYIAEVTNAITGVTQNLRNIQGKINGTMNPLEDLTASIDAFDASVTSLLHSPEALGNKLSDLVSAVFRLADSSGTIIDRTTGLGAFEGSPFERSASVRTTQSVALDMKGLGQDKPDSAVTALDRQKERSVRAINRLARTAALAAESEIYIDAPFDSSTTALEILETAVDEIGDLQDYSPSDDLFQALSDQRAAMAAFLTETATNLPRTITHTPKQEVPSILLAHMLYGDARLEAEIVLRNLPRYPLFLIDPLEVIEP